MRGRTVIAPLLALGVLLVSGCGTDESPSGAPDSPTPTPGATEVAVLRADGLGVAGFGTPADQAMDRLSDVLGEPTEDRTRTLAYEEVPGVVERQTVAWRSARWIEPGTEVAGTQTDPYDRGLRAGFSDGPYYRDDGIMHLVRWYYASGGPAPPLATDEGIGLGAAAQEAVEAYPEASSVLDPCLDQWVLQVAVPQPDGPYPDNARWQLTLVLTSAPDDPTATVESMSAGIGSIC